MSLNRQGFEGHQGPGGLSGWRLLAAALCLLLLAVRSAPATSTTVDEEAVLRQARVLIDEDPGNRQNMAAAIALLKPLEDQFPKDVRIPLYLAEASYLEQDPDEDIKKTFAGYQKVGEYAQKALALEPDNPKAHYWYGLYLLRKAQAAWMVQAYFITRNAVSELERVRRDLPTYDHAGPDRVLGLLYYLAPGWSPFGDLDKSIRLLKEAVRLDPGFLLNRLYLANAYNKKGDLQAAARQYQYIVDATAESPENKQVKHFRKKALSMLAELEPKIRAGEGQISAPPPPGPSIEPLPK